MKLILLRLFIEMRLRGGVATIARHYARANNPLLDHYDPSKENEYIYLDANNLCGWAISPSLPAEKFKWVDIPEDFDVMSFPENGPQGYILEVDLG